MSKILDEIKNREASWVSFRFTDTHGGDQHLTVPASRVDESMLEKGIMFDGSSIAGWKSINESDMILKPDDSTATLDPFREDTTVVVKCAVIEPATMQGYPRDPRTIAMNAEKFLQASGVADAAYFGPEPEFFVFDGVSFSADMQSSHYAIKSHEASWNNQLELEEGIPNLGHRPAIKGGYVPVSPIDSLVDLRNAMCKSMMEMGLKPEIHHHEVASGGQGEIGVPFNTLLKKADEVQILKYCIRNTADAWGQTATFMPKPIYGDNGSGMHVHISLSKAGNNVFAGDRYAGLSEAALFFIGGIIKHAKALNAITNPSTNSYKRLVPGFEAPVMLAYSARNRSASIRVPFVDSPKAKRIEVRFPDPMCNPYLGFSALLMAGLDGINNKIHPGEAASKNLYDLPPEENKLIPQVCGSFQEALENLDQDRGFLLEGDVFSDDMIDAYLELKSEEVQDYNMRPHPVEFQKYFSR